MSFFKHTPLDGWVYTITPLWKKKLTIDYKRFQKNHWEIFINSGVYFETHCSSINLFKSENSLVGFGKKNLSNSSDNSINQLHLNIWRSQKQHQEFSFKWRKIIWMKYPKCLVRNTCTELTTNVLQSTVRLEVWLSSTSDRAFISSMFLSTRPSSASRP